MKRPVFTFLAIFVTGCVSDLSLNSAPVEIKRTSEFVTNSYAGNHPTTIRSYAATNSSGALQGHEEFRGASCSVDGQGFSADFITPAIVNLPVYGHQTKAISGFCKMGSTTRPFVLKRFNISANNDFGEPEPTSSWVTTILGEEILRIEDIPERDITKDAFGYEDFDVLFPSLVRP